MLCLLCSKPTPNPKFCSRTCAAKVNNKLCPKRAKKERTCLSCGAKHTNSQRKFCSSCLEERKTKSASLTLGEVLKKLKGEHPSWVMSYVRRRVRQKLLRKQAIPPCEICGYTNHVEICHIKPIKAFPLSATIEEINTPSNLKFLCPNHHWEFDHALSN